MPISATSSALAEVEAGGAPLPLVTPMETNTVEPCGTVDTELALVLEAQPPLVEDKQSVVVVGVNDPTSVDQLLTRLNALIEPRPVARS